MSHSTRSNQARFTALDLKSVTSDGAFEGYASLFDREDLGHDVVSRGAFRDTLAARGPHGVRMLYQHNPSEPIGVWDSLVEDSKGLLARGRLMPDVLRAREVLALMRAGAIDGLSIGFKAIKVRRDRAHGIRRIDKIDLWEISIVTFPMLPEARISAVAPITFRSRTSPTIGGRSPRPLQSAAPRRNQSSSFSHIRKNSDAPLSPTALAAMLTGERALLALVREGLIEHKRRALTRALSDLPGHKLFNPSQLRVPSGQPGGGQWTGGDATEESDGLLHLIAGRNGPLAPGSIRSLYRDYSGHHIVPLAEAQLRSNLLSPDAVDILSRSTVGGELKDQSDPDNPHRGRTTAHREHDRAVRELTDRFIKENGIDKTNPMTAEQARKLVDAVERSPDPRIRSFQRSLDDYIQIEVATGAADLGCPDLAEDENDPNEEHRSGRTRS